MYRKLAPNIYEKTWTTKKGKKKTLYFKISVGGVHIHRNAYDPDNPHIAPKNLTEAKSFRDKLKVRLEAGQPAAEEAMPSQQVKFADFVRDVYLPFSEVNHRTHRNYLYYSGKLTDFFGGMHITSISPFDVERFKAAQMKRPKERGSGHLSGNTIRLYLACLSSIFQKAIDQGIRPDNPCSSVAPPELKPHKKRRLYDGEEERLLAAASHTPLHAFIILMLETAARPMELLRVERDDITWDAVPEERTIRLTSYKSKKRRKLSAQAKVRYVPLTERAWAEVEKLKADTLFSFDASHLRWLWEKACRAAKVERFWLRWLRDEAASRWAESGMNPFDIAALLGHADVKTSMIYINTSQSRLRELMSQSSLYRSKIVAQKIRQA